MDLKRKKQLTWGIFIVCTLTYLFGFKDLGVNWFVNILVPVTLVLGLFLNDFQIPDKKKKKGDNTPWYLLGILLLVTLLYLPTLGHTFSNWDDPSYVLSNHLIRNFNIVEIFSAPFLGMYQPLSLFSLQIDYFTAAHNATHYHVTNLLLHLLNCYVLFHILIKLFKQKEIALVATLLFGIHPVQVESVAWVTERKNVLFALFYLLSLWQYVKYVQEEKRKHLLWAISLFALSLLAKPQGVMLAVTLFLVDYLFGRKIPVGKQITEKASFFVLAGIAGALVFVFAEGETIDQPLWQSIMLGGFAFTKHIFQLIIPAEFSAIYPRPDALLWYHYLGFVVFLALLGFGFSLLKKNKELAFGAWFFILNIVLLLQFIPSNYFYMADRYNYIPSIGVFILLGYLFVFLRKKYVKSKNTVLYFFTGIAIVLALQTFQWAQKWGDDYALWDHVLDIYPNQADALNNRGFASYYLGQPEKAIADYNKAIKANPKLPTSYVNRGTLLLENQQIEQAFKDFNRALYMQPENATALVNRGIIYSQKGEKEKALQDFSKAIAFNPYLNQAYISRAALFAELGELQKSIDDYTTTIELDPRNPMAYSNRGLSHARNNNQEAALADFNLCLALDPEFVDAYSNRGFIRYKRGHYSQAISDFTYALKLNPNFANAYMNRGLALAEQGKTQLACADFQAAAKLGLRAANEKVKQYCR